MDFSYTEDQEALRELSRKILEELVTHERLKELEAGEERFDRQVWNELAKANLLGVPFEERFGGSGMGLWELTILLEEVGRAVASVDEARQSPVPAPAGRRAGRARPARSRAPVRAVPSGRERRRVA